MIQFNFNDGGRKDSGYKGFTGDCVCRSIAIASGKPYSEIYEALSLGNLNQRKSKYDNKTRGTKTAARGINTNRKWFKDYMAQLGFSWIPTMLIGQGCKVHLSKDQLPSGKIIAVVSKHYTAVIEGVLNDTFDCSREGTRCVYGYWKLN